MTKNKINVIVELNVKDNTAFIKKKEVKCQLKWV